MQETQLSVWAGVLVILTITIMEDGIHHIVITVTIPDITVTGTIILITITGHILLTGTGSGTGLTTIFIIIIMDTMTTGHVIITRDI